MFGDLLHGHGRFKEDLLHGGREFLQKLAAEGQSPDALYVGCSDSRVVPELLTTSSPGRLFVVRNIANQVPPLAHADASVGAALDYAVAHLHVPHVVVCGHSSCGGVAAVLDGLDHLPPGAESLREWLAPVREAVERAVLAGALELHAWVYDLHTLQLSAYDDDTGNFRPVEGLIAGEPPTTG